MGGVDRRSSACLRSRAAAETGAEKYESFCPPSRGERVAGSAEFRFSETPAADLEGTRQIIAAGRLRHLFLSDQIFVGTCPLKPKLRMARPTAGVSSRSHVAILRSPRSRSRSG